MIYKYLTKFENKDYKDLKASEFSFLIEEELKKHGTIKKEVFVPNRGDGRTGRIDLLFFINGKEIPIELDSRSPRIKSIFKITCYSNSGYVITRSPFKIFKVKDNIAEWNKKGYGSWYE